MLCREGTGKDYGRSQEFVSKWVITDWAGFVCVVVSRRDRAVLSTFYPCCALGGHFFASAEDDAALNLCEYLEGLK